MAPADSNPEALEAATHIRYLLARKRLAGRGVFRPSGMTGRAGVPDAPATACQGNRKAVPRRSEANPMKATGGINDCDWWGVAKR